jgi:hypothetical protein
MRYGEVRCGNLPGLWDSAIQGLKELTDKYVN